MSMVSQSEFCASLTVEFLVGNQVEQSVIHLMPSIEVSQIVIMIYGCIHSPAMITERHA